MDHALGMRYGEAGGEPVAQPAHVGDGERLAARDLRQRWPVDELHHQIEQAAVAEERAFVIDDRGVAQLAQRRTLAMEQLDELGVVGELGAQGLDPTLSPLVRLVAR